MKTILYTLVVALCCVAGVTNAQVISVTGHLQNTGGTPVPVTLDINGASTVSATTDPSGDFSTTMNIPTTQDWVHLSYTDCNGNTQHSYAMYSPMLMAVDFLKDYCPAMNPYNMHVIVMLDNTGGVPVQVTITPNFGTTAYTVTTDANGNGNTVIPVLDLLDPIEYSFTDCNGQVQSQIHVQFADTVDLFSADYCATGNPANPCDSAFTASYDATSNTFTLTMDSAAQSATGTYLWTFGDGDSSTAQFPTHVYAANGLYNVCLQFTSVLGTMCSYCHVIGIDSAGNPVLRTDAGFTLNVVPFNASSAVKPVVANSFDIYPNPVGDNGMLSLYTDRATDYTVSIYNALGQELKSINATSEAGQNIIQLPMQDLAKGMYLINVQFDGKQQSRSFVK